jgi:hypothetical protein
LAGKPIDQPGIFEGLDSEPPIIFNASLVFIFSFYFLYNPILLSCQACGLALAACRFLLVTIGLEPAPVVY